jgi:hypothetical protein
MRAFVVRKAAWDASQVKGPPPVPEHIQPVAEFAHAVVRLRSQLPNLGETMFERILQDLGATLAMKHGGDVREVTNALRRFTTQPHQPDGKVIYHVVVKFWPHISEGAA